jgi:hypothetical protein
MPIQREAFADLATFAVDQLLKQQYRELFSCFRTTGEDNLWDVFASYVRTSSSDPDVQKAIYADDVDCQDALVMQAIVLSYERIFLRLLERGALDRLLVVEELPPVAQADLDKMQANVDAAEPAEAPVAVKAPVVVDPVDTCVKDFHEMGSAQFQAKYLRNQNNRKFYDAAVAQGRL